MIRRHRADLEPKSTAIIRRAIELDQVEPSVGELVLSEGQLAQIAHELDISPAALGSALVEAKAGVDARPGLVDRIVGPRRVSANRLTEADETAVRERVIEWLEVTHGLRPRVTTDGVVVAAKRRDLAGVVATGLRRAQGLGGLSSAGEIKAATISTQDADGGVVCLVADVGSKRAEAILGGSAVAAGGTALVGVVALFTSPILLVGLPVAAGAGAVTSRLVHRQTIRRIGDSVEHTIDGVARGDEPPRPVGSLRRARRRPS